MSFTQGFLANIVIDSIVLTDVTVSTPLTRTKASLNKATMDGSGQMDTIPGMESGTLSLAGFMDDDAHNAIEVTWAKDDPVTFALTVLKGYATDASWSGLLTLLSITVDPAEGGLWAFSLDGETSGPVAYVPSVV